jgi:hypothetical protein
MAAVLPYSAGFHILLVHHDGDSNYADVLAKKIDPLVAAVARTLPGRPCVPVVPVRMTEAWVLADQAAVRFALGASPSTRMIDLPASPRVAERVAKPKLTLSQAIERVASATRSRRKKSVAELLPVIAQRASLDRLREAPSFARFERDVAEALSRLGYV